MHNAISTSTCTFCREFDDVEFSEFRDVFRKDILPSRIIKSTQNFIALAALGAIRPGYVLILPKEHMLSFAFLDQPMAEEAGQFKKELIQLMLPNFPNLIVFEHGPITAKASSGGCIDHAHLHIFPTAIDLFPRLSQQFSYTTIGSIHELSQFRKTQKHYIYYENNYKGFAFEIDRFIPSQYIRRILWEEEGKHDEWDWGVFIGYEHIIDTMRILQNQV